MVYIADVHAYNYIYILFVRTSHIDNNEVKFLPHARPRRPLKCPAASRDDAMTRLHVRMRVWPAGIIPRPNPVGVIYIG